MLGAADPSSGTVAVHEVIRGLGALLKEKWKPLRTIVIASWDAEEVGTVLSPKFSDCFFCYSTALLVAPSGAKTLRNGFKNTLLPMSTLTPQCLGQHSGPLVRLC